MARVEGDAADALDLGLRIDHGVDAAALARRQGLHPTGLTEIDVPGQLSHDQNVEPGDHLRLQGRGTGELGIENRRTQVGEQTQTGAQAQQPFLGPLGDMQRLPLGTAHGPEQDRIRRLRGAQGLLGQGIAGQVIGGTAHHPVLKLDVDRTARIERVNELHRLRHDLRTYAVAREHQNLLTQLSILCGKTMAHLRRRWTRDQGRELYSP